MQLREVKQKGHLFTEEDVKELNKFKEGKKGGRRKKNNAVSLSLEQSVIK
jgi:hypothetical protein